MGFFSSPYSIDVSSSGFAFESNIEYNIDAILTLLIKFPNDIQMIELQAVIKWFKFSEETKLFQYGAEFIGYESESKNIFLTSLAKQVS